MNSGLILVVDDEPRQREALAGAVASRRWLTASALKLVCK